MLDSQLVLGVANVHVDAVVFSVAVLAEIPLRSPQKIFILILKKNIYRIKVSKNKFI